jgi:hypothetical protein
MDNQTIELVREVHVTREHITKGTRGNTDSCPIGLAVKDAFPGTNKVSIAKYADGTKDFTFIDFILKWVADFDSGNEVEPFSCYAQLTFPTANGPKIRD